MLKVTPKSKRPPQKCPLCGQMNENIIMGTRNHPTDPKLMEVVKDKGYSFCNCRNIFYTDWDNIDQQVYDEDYTVKYDNPVSTMCLKRYFKYNSIVSKYVKDGNLLEIGCINPALLDEFKNVGFKTFGLDIIKHKFEGHTCVKANFEQWDTPFKFNVIWASHIFEHFKDPIAAVKKCNSLLNKDGVIFISMPDPYFIEYKAIYTWGHWHIKEHHMFWDLESFCDVLKENGFEIIFANHNAEVNYICNADMHIMARKI